MSLRRLAFSCAVLATAWPLKAEPPSAPADDPSEISAPQSSAAEGRGFRLTFAVGQAAAVGTMTVPGQAPVAKAPKAAPKRQAKISRPKAAPQAGGEDQIAMRSPAPWPQALRDAPADPSKNGAVARLRSGLSALRRRLVRE